MTNQSSKITPPRSKKWALLWFYTVGIWWECLEREKSHFLQIFEVARLWASSPFVFLSPDWIGPLLAPLKRLLSWCQSLSIVPQFQFCKQSFIRKLTDGYFVQKENYLEWLLDEVELSEYNRKQYYSTDYENITRKRKKNKLGLSWAKLSSSWDWT